MLYKLFQRVAFDAMEIAREKGIEVDKERIEDNRKKWKQNNNIGINWAVANKRWQNFE